MSYQVFARKYRPRTFADVLGQDHVVRTLTNAIEQKRLAHAYLFVGPRGTGKTSTARIFAKALNCSGGPRVDFDPDEDICQEIAEGRSLDVLEIDGASNRGIDHIRDLRDNVQFAPARGQYRIIYIDEVHMLTKESFNALLKTLEEPPAHVMFIFATTEPHKILPTILSRCQRFDLRPIPSDIIAGHLVRIAAEEGVELSEAAAYAIARVADGGMRDAQSMLDQLVSFCGNRIEEQNVNEIFGVTSRETVARALALMLDRQLPSLLHLLHELAESGRDMGQFLSEMMGAVRELLISKVAPEEASLIMPAEWKETLTGLLARTPSDKIIRLMEVLSATEERMRWSTNKRLHLEMGLVQAVHSLAEANISDIIRALNGAPLPETPIATTVLPEVALPASVQAPAAPAESASPPPAPAETAPPAEPEGKPAMQEETPMPPDLEPIDDAPPVFGEDSASSVEGREMTPELWAAAVEEVRRREPINASMIGNTLLIGEEGGLVTVAVNPADHDSRDALLGDELGGVLGETLQSLCGHAVSLNVVFDETVPMPQPEPVPEPVKKQEEAPPPPVKENPVEPAASLRPTDDEFYSDPLIEQALQVFHATLIKP